MAKRLLRPVGLIVATAVMVGGCAQLEKFDLDLRGTKFDTSDAAQKAPKARPSPDARGVISYPNYQVAVARTGDTLASLANRVGVSERELARYNGLEQKTRLRAGEIVALPRSAGSDLAEPVPQSSIEVSELEPSPAQPSGTTPLQHKVVRGETAYTIARLYGISVRSLAAWNGLDSSLNVREGQILLIPVAEQNAPRTQDTKPGEGTLTPVPPSATAPLPKDEPSSVSDAIKTPPTPDIGQSQSTARFTRPVTGRVIRDFEKGKTDGIDIAADVGAPVLAADAGTVAAITSDADQVPIIVVKHKNNLLTVYANIGKITVNKGAKVKRGQKLGQIRQGVPSYLHFEVRKGFESVDPNDYLN